MSSVVSSSPEKLCENSKLVSVDLNSSPPSAVPYAAALARTISEESPDPRIQVELERLNSSTDTINKLEVELDEARMVFRQLLADSTQRIDLLSKKLGKCVQQARPYYEARIKAKQAMQETQSACVLYERAVSEHTAAREMVFLAEEGLMQSGAAFDHTWQEMLNHASAKVNSAEKAKHECGVSHQKASTHYQEAEARVQQLQVQLKRAIARSSLNTRRSLLQMSSLVRLQRLRLLPYFEAKSQVNQQLEWQKQRVRHLELEVGRAKDSYASALSMLETISEQIHKRRESAQVLGVRGVGVGAESPSPCARERVAHLTSGLSDSTVSLDQSSMHDVLLNSGSAQSTVPLVSTSSVPLFARVSAASVSSNPATNSEASLSSAGSTRPFREALDGRQTSEAASVSEEKQSEDSTSAATEIATKNVPSGKLSPGDDPESSSIAPETTLVASSPAQQQLSSSYCSSLGGELSGWQVVGAPLDAASITLSIEDATMSDSESLASMEMLSDDAIAGLMLEDDLPEVNNLLATSATPYLTPLQESSATDSTDQTSDAKDCEEDAATSVKTPEPENKLAEISTCADRPSSSGNASVITAIANTFCTNPFLKDSAPYSSEALLSKIDTMITNAEVLNEAGLRRDVQVSTTLVSTVNQDSTPQSTTVIDKDDQQSRSTRLDPASCETNKSSSGHRSTSVSKSPTRPSSLPLITRNHPLGRNPAASFVPVNSKVEPRKKAETVMLPKEAEISSSSTNSSCSDRDSSDKSDPLEKVGLSRSNSCLSKDSAGTWSPELTTPAYAPLHDTLDSPFSQPPPCYPPPPPPRNLASNNTSD
ncbi:SH3-binding 5 [Trinorchestia longiramus]|nr:SH3-binding 5 [Trinorchestia longiramus]